MNILLHICCAPCSFYTIDKLRQDGHKVRGFFYNPNIYPLSEYKLRRQGVADMAKRLNVDVMYQEQPLGGGSAKTPEIPQRGIFGSKFALARPASGGAPCPLAQNRFCSTPTVVADKQQRCSNCWRMRLTEAVQTAKKQRFDAFSTTLLISPYQNHDEIRIIGDELGKKEKINFYYNDFRVGFKQSQQAARESGCYRQKYCGCEKSISESLATKRDSGSLGMKFQAGK
ncbi:MAG: hypothetical protein COY77_02580 [Candidatus Omnitrophica bacterium CG_4_10_14_0_8_um_filter_43_18]|nr:MAG: hypothetical protein AUJ89_03180 [Candidatus Omnitrophica bacterium CG1_02_43_210]PIY84400.1 MAG: hypothetical protein COY77_02580 [Candidatus Omnitrophica bacterium CG_4_10_14_0_8_um_filter_43_18]